MLFVVNALVFSTCYPLANTLAWLAGAQPDALLPFEPLFPFWPWMIIPYSSLVVILIASFFIIRRYDALLRFSRRLLLCTLIASLVFVAFPLCFPWPRPEPAPSVVAMMYRILSWIDLPYNQFPSLHVAYSVVLWREFPVRRLLHGWLLMVIASTVLTWQHMCLDVIGGLCLGFVACMIVDRPLVMRYVVMLYYFSASLLLLMISIYYLESWLGVYLSASLALVAKAYYCRNAQFLQKTNGCHPLWVWILYWPYLLGYHISWLIVIRFINRSPWKVLKPRLLVGRSLSRKETYLLPAGCSIIDLSPELNAPRFITRQRYWHTPMLDLVAPTPNQLRGVLRRIHTEHSDGYTVYIHCAMGLSRSIFVANCYARRVYK